MFYVNLYVFLHSDYSQCSVLNSFGKTCALLKQIFRLKLIRTVAVVDTNVKTNKFLLYGKIS